MASTKPKKKNPRLASGRKRVRQDVKINAANTSLRSKYRTAVKNVEKAVLAGDKTKAAELFAKMQSVVDNIADPPSGGFFVGECNEAQAPAAACGALTGGAQALLCVEGGSGSRQASTSVSSLSRAKFITKSQAMGSWSRRARLTTTHLTPLSVVGMHHGE